MKRLVVCCDGTWQDFGKTFPTNVAKIAAAVKPDGDDGVLQCVYYATGVGTNGLWNKLFGGGFGAGIDFNIKDAYRFLCLNYQPGDEIYLFGFSRGAYTVRSLAGLIYNSGLLRKKHIDRLEGKGNNYGAYMLYRNRGDDFKPSSDNAKNFRNNYCVDVCSGDDKGRVPITLLACWDTVGSLGIPTVGWLNLRKCVPHRLRKWIRNRSLSKITRLRRFMMHLVFGRYRFHDTRLSRIVLQALHVVAIDERRKVFDVTPMEQDPKKKDEKGAFLTVVSGQAQKLHQIWFPGEHGCIGGGDEKLQGMSDAALVWMMEQVKHQGLGLTFDPAQAPYPPDPAKFNYTIPFGKVSLFWIVGWLWRQINHDADFESDIHETAKKRWRDIPGYKPENLKRRFPAELKELEK
jgi:uncharacterized protein (DUF2235 family)